MSLQQLRRAAVRPNTTPTEFDGAAAVAHSNAAHCHRLWQTTERRRIILWGTSMKIPAPPPKDPEVYTWLIAGQAASDSSFTRPKREFPIGHVPPPAHTR